ncbi:tannase and feruloyl esterase-domain-containing protein [Favolaschia claudopus]|uniref:Carboxylic ester hydrolase n=1 Tax=Favolaschia claudopus TaxID=2862362 RepID=A0AAW0EDM3_9AGAR
MPGVRIFHSFSCSLSIPFYAYGADARSMVDFVCYSSARRRAQCVSVRQASDGVGCLLEVMAHSRSVNAWTRVLKQLRLAQCVLLNIQQSLSQVWSMLKFNLLTAAIIVAASTHISAQFQEPINAAYIAAATTRVPGDDPEQFPELCDSLAARLYPIPNSRISSTTFVAAGTTLTFPDVDPTCRQFSQPQLISVDMCRVILTVATTARSHISMETWLPVDWTGRFLSIGNGGIGGCVHFDDMDYGASLGFATSGSNNGHPGLNGTLFLDNPDVVEDFVFRALLMSAQVGKKITRTFFGRSHTKSYYLGCSTGGRQGWKMAQDFPDEFDGIVAGAPAFAWTGLMSWMGTFYPLVKNAGADFPPPSLWPVIDEAILVQCDGLDGAIDGIIEDPSRCDFRPEALLCAPSKRTSCLTSRQVDIVRAVFSPLFAHGAFMYPAYEFAPGLLGVISQFYNGSTQFLYTDHWYRFTVFNDTAFNTTSLTPDSILWAQRLNPNGINTFSGDISKFRDRGSKILHYHGQMDQLISSLNSNRYYELVSETMKMSPDALDDFYRFFRISGMQHCGGGPGAWFIGSIGEGVAGLGPDENVLTAMVRWVEQGVAPDTILGTAYVNQTKELGVDYQRAHCRYPYHNVFAGWGDVKNPDDWRCVLSQL